MSRRSLRRGAGPRGGDHRRCSGPLGRMLCVTLVDWLVVVAYLGVDRRRRPAALEGHRQGRRLLPRQPLAAVVGGRAVGDGDADERRSRWSARPARRYATGLRFVQFYFGLPLAMIILSLTVVPFFTRARVYTAYEYLEQRFDVRVRTLTSFLFLIGRALSLGVTLAAPAVVISAILGWSCRSRCSRSACRWSSTRPSAACRRWPGPTSSRCSSSSAACRGGRDPALRHPAATSASGRRCELAGATGRLQAIDFRFDLRETYTFWSGLIGGLFLMLSYFGCDQSQVQRYLTAKSIDEGAPLAADERVRQDPAAAADPGDRRAGLRVLPVPDAADAVQPRARRAGGGEPAGARNTRRSSSSSTPSSRAAARRPSATDRDGVSGRATRAFRTSAPGPPRSSSRRPATSATPTSTTCSRPSSRRTCRSGWSA